MSFDPFPAFHDKCHLHTHLLMYMVAYIANNMDQDQTALISKQSDKKDIDTLVTLLFPPVLII